MSMISGLPEGTTHVSTISVGIRSSGRMEASFRAFKQREDGEWLYYSTDNDNEYGGWHRAKPAYRNGDLPDLHYVVGLTA